MRKVGRSIIIILFFLFCAQVINAGPAYEILKAKKSCLVTVVKWEAPKEFLPEVVIGLMGFMERKGLTKIRFRDLNFRCDIIITRLEHIYSDKSFWYIVCTKETFGYFCYNLQKFGKNLKDDEFRFYKGLLCNDLASKRMTRNMIFNIFRLMEFFRQYSPR